MSNSPADVYDRLWQPKAYLRQYYATSHVAEDEQANIAFARRLFQEAKRTFPLALEVGCGPTLHHAMLLAPYVGELHLADYLAGNLAEISESLAGNVGAHDWGVYLGGLRQIEGGAADDRWHLLQERVSRLIQMDLRQPQSGAYDLVASYYCAECVASTQLEWRQCLASLAGLLSPGGVLLLGVVRRCRSYNICGTVFPASSIDEEDLAGILPSLGFDQATIVIEAVPVAEWSEQGFDGICCVWAQKRSG